MHLLFVLNEGLSHINLLLKRTLEHTDQYRCVLTPSVRDLHFICVSFENFVEEMKNNILSPHVKFHKQNFESQLNNLIEYFLKLNDTEREFDVSIA